MPGGPLSCVGPQADLFFSEDAARVEHAKALCATCPSRMPCLAGALARREPWGVWGGRALPRRNHRAPQASSWSTAEETRTDIGPYPRRIRGEQRAATQGRRLGCLG